MLTALELRRAFQSGSLSPVEFVPAADPEVGAVTVWAPETAAASSERRYRDGTARLLEGLPYVVKDLLDTEGIVTSYGSALFAGHVPTRSAAAVTRVSAAGALMLGKTTTHEFGWGFATSGEPRTRNPWDLSRTPGGSSGGSAAALATATAPLALGSDTGGSVRVPAAFCGVVGFRPTYGLIDGTGLFPLAPSMDTVGPMARTPADVALLFTALTGDSPTWLTELERNQRDPVRLPGKRIGLLSDTPAAAKLTDLGAHVQPVSIPPAQDFYIPIMVSEALAVHRRLGLLPDRFAEYTPDVQARIQLAEQFSSTEVADANAQRLDLREHLTACFRDVDVLLGPVSSGPPPSLDAVADLRSQLIPWVAPQSLAGLPACVLRAGFDSHGLPIGVQITGKPGADKLVLEIASVLYGTDPDLHTRWPTMRVP